MNIFNKVSSLFNQITSEYSLVEAETMISAKEFVTANSKKIISNKLLKDNLYAAISNKLKLNEKKIKNVLTAASKSRIVLNYHMKVKLTEAFNCRNDKLVKNLITQELAEANPQITSFHTDTEIQAALKKELAAPLNRRTKERSDSLSQSLITAIFAEYIFKSIPYEDACKHYDPLHKANYFKRISQLVSTFQNDSPALTIGYFDCKKTLDGEVNIFIDTTYKTIRNHSFMSVIIECKKRVDLCEAWSIALNSILFAEKNYDSGIRNSFYKADRLKEELKDTFSSEKLNELDLSIPLRGFQYLDTFVTQNNKTNNSTYLVIIFELNRQDETKLVCPSCRSKNIQGNSYSKLGVKSWECNNLICSDRSRTNRGKRFSLYSIIRQQAILNRESQIPQRLIKKWNRDVANIASTHEIFEMLIRFYSVNGDHVNLYNHAEVSKEGRKLVYLPKLTKRRIDAYSFSQKNLCSYLNRCIYTHQLSYADKTFNNQIIGRHELFRGDSTIVMKALKESSICCAITSPPYYNAREYSQWPNIYAFLIDMADNAKEVLRLLENGGLYLFNIFDYFDNENDIVRSAMGEKRLILSAQIKKVFELVGFQFAGNVVWDKGHIEGKRGFNSGNLSPFFQHPFNCWEHILIFSKGEVKSKFKNIFPTILKAQAVVKMVKGKNVYGHTAPYPIAIPELLIKHLDADDVVLDPYAGSFTTSIVAEKYGVNSIGIEKNSEYFQLGKERLTSEIKQLRLI
jgi:DNA modification methylase